MERLETLGITAFEAARIADFQRNYFHDLIIGKKHSIREKNLAAAAFALKCDPEYLTGLQDTPRRSKTEVQNSAQEVLIAGSLAVDLWQGKNYRNPSLGPIAIEPDKRYPADAQEVFYVHDDHAEGLNLPEGTLIRTVKIDALEDAGRKLRNGDIVVVSREDRDLMEFSVRVYEETSDGVRLSAKPAPDRDDIAPIKLGDGAQIRGLLLRATLTF